MKDIEILGREFDNVAGFKMPDLLGNDVTFTEGGGTPNLETVTKTYTPTTSQQTETITPSSGYDGIGEVDVTVNAIPEGTEGTPTATKGSVSNHSVSVTPSVTNSAGYIAGGTHNGTAVTVSASELDSGTKSITANGTGIDVVGYAAVDVNVSSGGNLQNKTKTYTPAESQQTETVSADTGYDGLGTVDVTVNAVSSSYVGSGVTRRSSTDLSASGATVTAPSGYYESNATKTIASGTEGTPTATKGTVSNHAISVTPSVTNSTGYILGGTHTGTAVSVSASELVSGTLTISSSGTKDVTNYASASVAAGTATPAASISATGATVTTGTNTLTLSKSVSNTPQVSAGYVSSGTAGNSSVSLTATVTTQAAQTIYPSASDQTIAESRYLTGAQTIKAVTTTNLTAANIKSGVVVEVGDSSDSDRVLSVTGTYSGGGSSKNVQAYEGYDETNATDYTATDVSITVSKAGTYKCAWMGLRNTTSGTSGSRLYVNGEAAGSAHTSGWIRSYGQYATETLTFSANDVVTVYGRARASNYYMVVGNLIIEEQ